MTKKTEKSTKERNRKAASILRGVDDQELAGVTGGFVVKGPGGGPGDCFTCGLVISVQ